VREHQLQIDEVRRGDVHLLVGDGQDRRLVRAGEDDLREMPVGVDAQLAHEEHRRHEVAGGRAAVVEGDVRLGVHDETGPEAERPVGQLELSDRLDVGVVGQGLDVHLRHDNSLNLLPV
jgi:hypothetical protein